MHGERVEMENDEHVLTFTTDLRTSFLGDILAAECAFAQHRIFILNVVLLWI